MTNARTSKTGNMYEEDYFDHLDGGGMHPGGTQLTARAIDLCALPQGARVIDVGCGTGVSVEYLRRVLSLDAAGVDISGRLIERGKQRYPGLPLLQADAGKLPFSSETIDAILAECSISVLNNPEHVLGECYRVLKPGGKLAVTDVYARRCEALPAFRGLRSPACFAAVMSREEWLNCVSRSGYFLRLWEDCSDAWRQFVATLIMRNGSLPALCRRDHEREHSDEAGEQDMRQVRPGYFLLIAEKMAKELPDSE
jgi:ubiquinone/menaquinone biosynthesis C-methylase UbiE